MFTMSKSLSRADQRPQVPDGVYLFACHLAWLQERSLWAYEELVRALDGPDEEARLIAETLLRRRSPRPTCAPRQPAERKSA